jgi:hypothetical protein
MKWNPPARRRLRPMPDEPGVLLGPEWQHAVDGCRPCHWNGPRLCIEGRWVSAVRGSSMLYLRRWFRRERIYSRAGRLDALRFRIGDRLGRYGREPF